MVKISEERENSTLWFNNTNFDVRQTWALGPA